MDGIIAIYCTTCVIFEYWQYRFYNAALSFTIFMIQIGVSFFDNIFLGSKSKLWLCGISCYNATVKDSYIFLYFCQKTCHKKLSLWHVLLCEPCSQQLKNTLNTIEKANEKNLSAQRVDFRKLVFFRTHIFSTKHFVLAFQKAATLCHLCRKFILYCDTRKRSVFFHEFWWSLPWI